MGMDRRQIKTRTAIFNAISDLLSEKRYDNISVQEIADRANIGRSTFYAHFETKDDLLKSLCDDLFNHVFLNKQIIESTHNFYSNNGDDYYAAITHILYHLKESRRDILSILSCESSEMFLRYFKEYFDKLYVRRVITEKKANKLSVPQNFLINHISGSFINMVQWWIKDGMKQTPEELTEYFKLIINSVVSEI